MYVCMYVLMYDRLYILRVILTINIYYFPTQYPMIFFLMCKDYVLCAAETEVSRLFVVADTQKFTRTNISNYFFPSLMHLFINKYFLERRKTIIILNGNYHLK
jgi:hypothetical protein